MSPDGVVRATASEVLFGNLGNMEFFVPKGARGAVMGRPGRDSTSSISVRWDEAYPVEARHDGRRESIDPVFTSHAPTGSCLVEIDWNSPVSDDPDDDQDLDPMTPEHSEVVRQALFGESSLFGDGGNPQPRHYVMVPAVGDRVFDGIRFGNVVRHIVEARQVVTVFRDQDGKDHFTDPAYLAARGPGNRMVMIEMPEVAS